MNNNQSAYYFASTALSHSKKVATPIGWIGLILGGVTVAGFAAVTSISVNSITKDKSGIAYDCLMKKIL